MGREIKRVAVNFVWPMNKVWKGYLCPGGCNACEEKEDYDCPKYGPPNGHGYQLWENVSEGSPISPVFNTQGEFKDYLMGLGHSERAVDIFIHHKFAPSMVVGPDGIKMGIDACEDMTTPNQPK